MKLSKLVEHIEYELVQGSLDTEVADIAYDSRKIKEGMLFVAIAGTVVDGHKYIPDDVKKGASVLVVEKEIESIDESITVIRVANGRAALSLLSQAYFDYPASKMISIGITGTKGKSTTTYMIRDIIEKSGKTCGIVGTIGVAIAGKVTPTEHTTPESYDLQRYFKDMVGAGCEYMVMEVSSQGIKMDRVAGMHFNYGIFTNITPDHIGPNEHADFNEYLYCKSRLFTMCDVGIVNRDDPHWKEMIKDATCEIKTYGTEDADMTATEIEHVNNEGNLCMKFHANGLLNGDIIVWNPVLQSAFEISSMGIRVDRAALEKQLWLKNAGDRKKLYFHSLLLEGKLPQTMGGGIGQSRLCMLLLQKCHIGEVQAGLWPDEVLTECEKAGVFLF